jgi:hypothetical protein
MLSTMKTILAIFLLLSPLAVRAEELDTNTKSPALRVPVTVNTYDDGRGVKYSYIYGPKGSTAECTSVTMMGFTTTNCR